MSNGHNDSFDKNNNTMQYSFKKGHGQLLIA